jgi:hypothetical protein
MISYLPVIASAAKQPRGKRSALDCFVAVLLAMTVMSRIVIVTRP